ncbi:hypothetical protein BH23CHL5_BH23CHL5_08500 [soil metagenome]
MLVTRPAVRTCIGVLALAVALSALLLPQGFATSAEEVRDDDIQGAFATLRVTIEEGVPGQLQPAFLAQVDAAEHLLLPAIQFPPDRSRSSKGAAVRRLQDDVIDILLS